MGAFSNEYQKRRDDDVYHSISNFKFYCKVRDLLNWLTSDLADIARPPTVIVVFTIRSLS